MCGRRSTAGHGAAADVGARGVNTDGTIPSGSDTAARLLYHANLRQLLAWFTVDERLRVRHTLTDGTAREITGEVLDSVTVQRSPVPVFCQARGRRRAVRERCGTTLLYARPFTGRASLFVGCDGPTRPVLLGHARLGRDGSSEAPPVMAGSTLLGDSTGDHAKRPPGLLLAGQ